MRKTRNPKIVVEEDTDVVYKDVVIVGNGPGAICLSYMLAGNWPYYEGEPHPRDEMLSTRLNNVTRDGDWHREQRSGFDNENIRNGCYEINKGGGRRRRCKITNKKVGGGGGGTCLAKICRSSLASLAFGVEGRGGGKPLALLMDQLQHPCVDVGLDVPSLLAWFPGHKIIDHAVLGKGPPGGSWQTMDPRVLTISLKRWMSLPTVGIEEWCGRLVEPEDIRKSLIMSHEGEGGEEAPGSAAGGGRVPVGTVAAYYEDYVRFQGLEKYFKCGRTVTSVRPIQGSSGNIEDDEYGWIVRGYENDTAKRFLYKCKRVVLATGTMDSPNRLDLPGEESQPTWITHDLNDFENKLDRLANENVNCCCPMIDESDNCEKAEVKRRVLIVGAGLSAADAVMAARFRGIPVLHVFRETSSDEWSRKKSSGPSGTRANYDRLQWLPASVYPEYHKVYEMMADAGSKYPLYKPLAGYSLVDLIGSNENETFGCRGERSRIVTLSSPNGQLQNYRVSIVAILIGSRPDLSYLGEYATRLGKMVDKPIDGKANTIETDDFTYEAVRSPRKGLYALGPLVGDNFVRFLLGGAFGILAHILDTSSET